MSTIPRLEVDFNSRTPDGNVIVGPAILPELKSLLGEPVVEGIAVSIYEEGDIEVTGKTAFNEEFGYWVVVPDWATLRDL